MSCKLHIIANIVLVAIRFTELLQLLCMIKWQKMCTCSSIKVSPAFEVGCANISSYSSRTDGWTERRTKGNHKVRAVLKQCNTELEHC